MHTLACTTVIERTNEKVIKEVKEAAGENLDIRVCILIYIRICLQPIALGDSFHQSRISIDVRLCVCVLTCVCMCVDMCVCVTSLLCVNVLICVCLCVDMCVCVTCLPTSSSAPHAVAAAAACSSSIFALFAASLSLYRMSHKSFLRSFYISHVAFS